MFKNNRLKDHIPEKLSLKLAIFGGGKTCKSFLTFLQKETLPYLEIKLVGVCDIDPQAEGFLLAQKLGIYTTKDYRDLFNIKGIDGIIELTNSNDALLELLIHRPKNLVVLEHNTSNLLKRFFTLDQRLQSAEKQVIREKMISEFLIRQAKQRILVLNTDFSIAEANKAFLNSIDKSESEIVGRKCYQVIHGSKIPCSFSQTGFECPMIETLRTGEPSHIIMEEPGSGDQLVCIDNVVYPIKNSDDEITKVIVIWRDITDELVTRWERRAEELIADLPKIIQEDRLISLGKLVASCVHEINNPIHGLLTFSSLMLETLEERSPTEEDITEFKKFLSLMTKELQRCGDVISGLLSFSRESNMEYGNVDLNEVLDAVITLTRHKMELQNINLKTELFHGPLLIRGDIKQLQQCFLNLVFNAIEAMPVGGDLYLTSSKNETKKLAKLEFKDTGNGIAEEIKNHIFDPFFTTKQEQGTGMGLSMVYGVVKKHEGTLKVSSQINKGSSFELIFPLQ
jgi:signal transduction histidine kinase